jgi:hypothetical protein
MVHAHPRLTRDELVTIITDFYIFLTKLYLPLSAIKFPPRDGWPNITPETTQHSNKSRFVIDLMKHLPYIEDDNRGESGFIRYIHYKSEIEDYSTYQAESFIEQNIDAMEDFLVDWAEEFEETKKKEAEEREDENEQDENEDDSDQSSQWSDDGQPLPSDLENMLTLASGHESGGRNIVLDVFRGLIYEEMIRCSNNDAIEVEHYFSGLRTQFEKLEMVPTPKELHDQFSNSTEGADEYKRIYRECGWPGEGYRKEEAMVKIKECRQREIEREEEEDKLQDEERDRQMKEDGKI